MKIRAQYINNTATTLRDVSNVLIVSKQHSGC
jgi:hypothetical protein